jgi:LacI family transcriptional regulator
MATRRANVTIRDVAKKAGVSVATVSRVFNDSDLVVAKTEDRIKRIALELNYIPSGSARSLSIRKTETIGLLLPDLYGDFFSEIIRGADSAARSAKYHLIVSSSHSNTSELDAAVKTLSGKVDGMIIMSPHLDSSTYLRSVLKAMPTVILGSSSNLGKTDYITIDNVGGARQIAQHLLQLGHQRLVIIRGEKANIDAEERLKGYLEVMDNSGRPVSKEDIVEGDFTEESGYESAKRLLARQNRPTAIFASNDSMAIGVLRRFREEHVAVPDEIAVAGFDDILISSYVHPGLTTVHVDISQLGIRGVNCLLNSLFGKRTGNLEQRFVLPAKLVIRESTVPSTKSKNTRSPLKMHIPGEEVLP